MPIVTWTRINPTTERHLPTGVEVVKVPAKTADNPTSRIKWMVRHPQLTGGTRYSWMRTTRTDAKAIAESHNIPGVYAKRDEAHAEAIEIDRFWFTAANGTPAEVDAVRIAHAAGQAGEPVSLRVQSTTETPQVAVIAPQLHPEDTPKWDPHRRLADVPPASDHELAHFVGRFQWSHLGMLARLRKSELELARARAELIRREAEQHLHLARGGDWGLPRADGSCASSGLPVRLPDPCTCIRRQHGGRHYAEDCPYLIANRETV